MNAHLPDRRPSGEIIEQAGASVGLGAVMGGIALIGIAYAGANAAKQAGDRTLKYISCWMPIGGPT